MGQIHSMPTYRSLVQRGPLLFFAPCRTRCVTRDGGRAEDWLAEGGGERSSHSGGSWFSTYSLHLYWSAHGWRAPTQGFRKGLSNNSTTNYKKENLSTIFFTKNLLQCDFKPTRRRKLALSTYTARKYSTHAKHRDCLKHLGYFIC